jgi:hypothetical protein
MVKAAMEHNWTGLAASLLILQQVAGPAFIPKTLQGIAWYASPDNFAKFQEFIRFMSIGEHVFGDLEHLTDYDPILFPLLGVDRPGVEQLRDTIGDLDGTVSKLNDVMYQLMYHPQRFTGDKGARINMDAQKHLKSILNDYAFISGFINSLPVGRLPAMIYNLPSFLHKEFEVQPPKNILGESKGSPQLKRYPEAQQDAVRAMLGLPQRMEMANYQGAKYGLSRANLTGQQESELIKEIQRTGIPK